MFSLNTDPFYLNRVFFNYDTRLRSTKFILKILYFFIYVYYPNFKILINTNIIYRKTYVLSFKISLIQHNFLFILIVCYTQHHYSIILHPCTLYYIFFQSSRWIRTCFLTLIFWLCVNFCMHIFNRKLIIRNTVDERNVFKNNN